MKANRRLRARAEAGAVGIGTMIVFIATILVAAVAAAVLIDTSGLLQERAQKTGLEATRDVSSNLFLKGISGNRTGIASTDKILNLSISVSLAPGAPAVDLKQLVVEVNNGTTVKRLTHVDGESDDGTFNVTEVRDEDGSFTSASPVLTAGDLILINVNLNSTANDMPLGARSSVVVSLIPESGAQIHADFTTPASFGTNTVIRLR